VTRQFSLPLILALIATEEQPMSTSENLALCILCEEYKPISKALWGEEHILPFGFGNDGKTDATLKYKICKACNSTLGDVVVKPFLRNVISREIAQKHGMKRRKKSSPHISGSSFVIRYKTTSAHLLMCIVIALETHMKFLSVEYRDDTFHLLRKIILNTISDFTRLRNILKSRTSHIRTLEQIWADTTQGISLLQYPDTVYNHVYNLDEVASNVNEIIADVRLRSSDGSYASVIQLGCWNFGIAVMICLQSLPSIVVCVSKETVRYINEFGSDCLHIMDLRSAEKWVGQEHAPEAHPQYTGNDALSSYE
jgi:hypothetical protein